MARGYPDYFGQSIWPKYGTIIVATDTFTIGAMTDDDVISISGMGVFYHFRVYLNCAVAMGSSQLSLRADGVTLAFVQPEVCPYYDVPFGGRSPLQLSWYEPDETYLVATLGVEVPFHDSFILRVLNAVGSNITGGVRYGYYNVT